MKIAIIVALAQDGAIGQDNRLLWHLSADLKRFKALTTGHSIIMGRKTFESLPNGALPNRRNIVLSRSLHEAKGAELVSSLPEALKLCEGEDWVYIIGGGQVYRDALPWADELHLTEVEASYPEADTHFPDWDKAEWALLREEVILPDERNEHKSTYRHLRRIKEKERTLS